MCNRISVSLPVVFRISKVVRVEQESRQSSSQQDGETVTGKAGPTSRLESLMVEGDV
jgi:hypothetical protein